MRPLVLPLLLSCSGCYALLALVEPVDRAIVGAEYRKDNGHISVAGRIVSTAGEPLDRCSVQIRSARIGGVQEVFSSGFARFEQFEETRIVGPDFSLDFEDRMLLDLVFSHQGFFDTRVQLRLNTPHLTGLDLPVRPALDQQFTAPHPMNKPDLVVVMQPGRQVKLDEYQALLQCEDPDLVPVIDLSQPPGPLLGAATRLVHRAAPFEPHRLYVYPERADDQKLSFIQLQSPHDHQLYTFPRRLKLVVSPGDDSGLIPTDAANFAELKTAPINGYQNGLILDQTWYRRALASKQHRLFFYFKTKSFFGKGSIQLHPHRDIFEAQLWLFVQRDGSRHLDTKR